MYKRARGMKEKEEKKQQQKLGKKK